MSRRAAWVLAVLGAVALWCAPANAAQISGSLKVTKVTSSTVTFSVTVKRTCTGAEQCDYFSVLDEVADTTTCPAARAADPSLAWTGEVQTAGPTTETAKITPRAWLRNDAPGAVRLCLYTYADGVYYLADGRTVSPPAPGDGGPGDGGDGGDGGEGGGAGGGKTPSGVAVPDSNGRGGDASTPVDAKTVACYVYNYQQSAQEAMQANRALASRLDRNGNGIACENLPKRKNYVQTLSLAQSAVAARTALRRAYGTSFTQGKRFHTTCTRRSRTRIRCTVGWTTAKGRWSGYVDVIGSLRANQRIVTTSVHVKRP